jgi:uncharacterized protein with PQ loop repeat
MPYFIKKKEGFYVSLCVVLLHDLVLIYLFVNIVYLYVLAKCSCPYKICNIVIFVISITIFFAQVFFQIKYFAEIYDLCTLYSLCAFWF